MGQEEQKLTGKELRILVTGGQGFLGAALVRALLEQGYLNITATARRPAPDLESLGARVLRVDLADHEAAVAAASNQDLIFHTAAKAGVWGRFEDYHSANVAATESLLEGARVHGVSHFVQTSSPSVTFSGASALGKDESTPYSATPLNAYCATKIRAERAVLAAHRWGGLRTLALRPHLIYGPNDPHLLPRLFEAASRGRLVQVGDGQNWVDVTHIRDTVAAHVAVLARLDKEAVWGRPYFLTSGQPVLLWSWIADLLAWKRLPPVQRSLGMGPAVALGLTLEWVYRLLKLKGEPPITRFAALQLGCSHTYSIEQARALLGYSPVVDPHGPFDEQFASTW